MASTLLLWDIDGTILHSGGAGIRAIDLSLQQDMGIDGDTAGIAWAGRTDRWITGQVFAKHGIPLTEANATRFIDGYLNRVTAELTRSGHVLPGVEALLRTGHARPDVAQGLLTGNLERGARVKLGHFGLWEYFAFGAFADDSEDRNELGPHALRRATAVTGVTFEPSRVWIIGDTPHDIACGKVIGARTLAVATGHHTREELAAFEPTAIMDDLSDEAAFWALVTA